MNHAWSAGSGNVTDSYNVSVNNTWHNTTPAYYNNTGLSAHAWSNVTVYAFNSSGTYTRSAGSVSQNTQIPNNPVTITNTSGWSGDAGESVYVDYDATDADSDNPTFSCNRTDLFTDFSTTTGTGNWLTTYTDAGPYHVDFGISDGWGSTDNYTMAITVNDITPPASIAYLDNLTTEQSRIRWTWTDPTDNDFAKVMIYLDGTFKTNVSKGDRNYTATGLDPDTNYTIGTHTVDDKGNINQTWENDTARTLPFSGLQRINVTPTAWTMNITEHRSFNATGFDHYDDPIDPANLTFKWYTTPSGVGTLNATTGHVVNFTALHAGRTEIYAVNGSVTDSTWITVNAPPKTEDVTNGTSSATSGNSTAIVKLTNTSVNGTITIEEIGDPINRTEDIGNQIGLGASKSVKGVNVTVKGSIEAALNDTGSYVHIRIEYNESQLGNIDENTLYIYKFVNGTGWVRLVAGNPSYCTANGRNTTVNCVWVNVTECSILMITGTEAATPTPSGGGSSGGGTYPPGWSGTPTPTVTATKAPAASATATATDARPDDKATPAPTKKPAVTKTTTPAAEDTTAGAAKNGAPGFTAVFVIAGMLAVAYAMMQRRE